MGIEVFPNNIASRAAYYQGTAPTSPVAGDVWVDSSSTSETFDLANYPAKVWNGSEWLGVGTQVADISPYALKDGSNWQASWMGAWTSYTPTLAQGASTNISKTSIARYCLIGKTVHARIYIGATGTGTGNNEITITAPVTAHTNTLSFGIGRYNDSGTATYPLMVVQATTTTFRFIRSDTATPGVFGTDPNIAVASGDELWATITYEAA